jgi:hypothetical protein
MAGLKALLCEWSTLRRCPSLIAFVSVSTQQG